MLRFGVPLAFMYRYVTVYRVQHRDVNCTSSAFLDFGELKLMVKRKLTSSSSLSQVRISERPTKNALSMIPMVSPDISKLTYN